MYNVQSILDNVEIERKYLLKNLPNDLNIVNILQIEQGYLAVTNDIEIRLRKVNDKEFYQTVKSSGSLKREEVEFQLDKKNFLDLWSMTKERRISKTRYRCKYLSYLIDIDVYENELKGMMVMEVEFSSEEKSVLFTPPDWIQREITYDDSFKNKNLSKIRGISELGL